MLKRIQIVFLLSVAVAAAQTSARKPAASLAPRRGAGAPIAVFDTTAGTLRCTLFEKQAPKTVANFIALAEGTKKWQHPVTGKWMTGTPLYNGTTFHRVIPNFMVQGGDPAGNGSGGVGYTFEDEFRPELKFDRPGRLAMANSGPATNGSQFFITEVPTPHLDACTAGAGCERPGLGHVPKGFGHTIFGQCDPASIALVNKISRRARDPRNNKTYAPVKINRIIIERPGSAKTKPVAAPRKP